jgi:hypothetical protein
MSVKLTVARRGGWRSGLKAALGKLVKSTFSDSRSLSSYKVSGEAAVIAWRTLAVLMVSRIV